MNQPTTAGNATETAILHITARLLRMLLEAIDGRRPLRQIMHNITNDTAREYITTFVTRPTRDDDPAQLNQLLVQINSARTAEFFGTYRRGDRVHAIAGRIVNTPTGWRIHHIALP